MPAMTGAESERPGRSLAERGEEATSRASEGGPEFEELRVMAGALARTGGAAAAAASSTAAAA